MDRELKEIILPSGKKAKIVSYYTRGEKVAIEKEQWGNAEASIGETGDVDFVNIPINHVELKKNAMVLHGTKEIDGIIPTNEIINDMPSEDFNILYKELNIIYTGKKNENSNK